MSGSLRSALLDVDLAAVRHNLAQVKRLAGAREIIASIKANAYGFGVIEVSRMLVAEGVAKLWTGNLDEAIALREAGIDAEILLFGGPEPRWMDEMLAHDLQPTIFDDIGLAALAAAGAKRGRPGLAWIKVDAGLGRLGVPLAEALAFIERVAATSNVELRGVYSHLPFGSAEGEAWAIASAARFEHLLADLAARGIQPPVTQLWGSSGLLAGLPDLCNAVCVGHALYGLNPLDPGVGDQPLRPALAALHAAVLRVGEAGSGGGYGVADAALAATVAIGLGDGLRNAIHGPAEILIGGRRAPIRGFTLEHLMVDATGTTSRSGHRAIVIGGSGDDRISLDDWAKWTGGTPLEVMMSLSGKTPVAYLDGD